MLTRNDIAHGLRALGLDAGDTVLVHSSLSSLGTVDGGAEAVVAAFLDVLGERGTLVVPTFGDFGAIMAAVRTRPDAVHSLHPLASMAAVGPRATAICRDHWQAPTAHGDGTPYMRIAELGGFVCLLGVDQDRNTTLHAVEALLELPYLSTVQETFATPDGKVTRSWPHFPGPHRDFIGLDRRLREHGIVRLRRIGDAAVRLMQSRPLIDHLLEVGRADPAFALCANPSCADCTTQRAAIRRHRFGQECFRVVASAGLAGDSVDEIARNCAAAGIDVVELDELGGTPLAELTRPAILDAVAALRAAGCVVSGLRSRTPPESATVILDTARAAGVGRLVLPLTDNPRPIADAAAVAGIEVSYHNQGMTSLQVFELLDALRADGREAHLAFDPVEFVREGEKPFLTSLRNRLKRHTDQLDLQDATFAGEPTRLGAGNGEVKELVSILRCSSFAGTVCLGPATGAVADLRQTAIDIEQMLQAL